MHNSTAVSLSPAAGLLWAGAIRRNYISGSISMPRSVMV